jgi:hypothetical protein
MSIHDQIAALVGSRELFVLGSEMFGDETARTLFITEEVRSAVFPPFPEKLKVLHAEFRQELDAFLEGSWITVAENPKAKPSDARMARVCPIF